MNIGKSVKEARRLTGLTQQELSARIGYTQATLSKVEKGHQDPSAELLSAISRETKIPPAALVWLGLDEKDIRPEKRDAFRLIKPAMDNLVKSIFE